MVKVYSIQTNENIKTISGFVTTIAGQQEFIREFVLLKRKR